MDFDLKNYTIRRKILKIFGAAFHVYDSDGRVVGFSSQKAFKLKEDIRVFGDESKSEEILSVKARQIIDFSAAYDVVDAREGRKVGAARRKGWTSMLQDAWELLDASDHLVARLQEDSALMAMLRRFLSNLIPQKLHIETLDGALQANMRVRFNPFIYKLDVEVAEGATVDPRLIFASGVLLAAIEGRQK
ncbi:MAG: hypothetical protein ACYSX0_03890 [Planctomycetota bacterium]|jgi:hypothetical protein